MTSETERPDIEVLLATWNGARFLEAQLDSLFAQSERGFCVLVGDDGSDDGTLAILDRYERSFPGVLRRLEPAPRRLGPLANFARLLDAASARYVMFCDQDDVWLPGKIAKSLELMRDVERAHGNDWPVLVHTDLAVVDASCRELGPSFAVFSGIDPQRNTVPALLLGNVVTGCTIMANRALYAAARPVPAGATMFDHWLALVAAGIGTVAYLDEATCLYRQHAHNAIGAQRAGAVSLARRAARSLFGTANLRVLAKFTNHATALAERFSDRLGPENFTCAKAFAGVWALPRHRRFASLFGLGLMKPGLVANIGLFILLTRDGGRLAARRGAGSDIFR